MQRFDRQLHYDGPYRGVSSREQDAVVSVSRDGGNTERVNFLLQYFARFLISSLPCAYYRPLDLNGVWSDI